MPELFRAQEPIIKTNHDSTEGSEHVHGLVLHPKHMNDLALWKAFKSGDEKAFMTIFDRSTKPMYNYGCKVIGDGELVKDAIQELFIEVWQTRSRLRDTDSIKFYLFKCLRRKLIKLKTKSEKQHYGNLSVECNEDASPSYEFLLISEQIELEKKEKGHEPAQNADETATRSYLPTLFRRSELRTNRRSYGTKQTSSLQPPSPRAGST